MPQSPINLIRWVRASFAQYRHGLKYNPETYEWQDYTQDDDDDAWQLTRAGGRV